MFLLLTLSLTIWDAHKLLSSGDYRKIEQAIMQGKQYCKSLK